MLTSYRSLNFFSYGANCTFINPGGSGDGAIALANRNDRDSVYGCTFYMVDSTTYPIIKHGCGSSNATNGGNFFCNNTVYGIRSANDAFVLVYYSSGYAHGAQTYQNEIKYNILQEMYDNWQEFHVAQTETSDEHYFEIDSNAYYDTQVDFTSICDGASRDSTGWQNCGHDPNSYFSLDVGLTDPANGDFTPTQNLNMIGMDRTYGGQDWTLWGAVQPAEVGEPGTRSNKLRGVK